MLSRGDVPVTFWVDEDVNEQIAAHGLPFKLIELIDEYVDEESGRPYSKAALSCPHLTNSGRCGIYESRPEVCSSFEPGSSPLCVHYQGAEAGADEQ